MPCPGAEASRPTATAAARQPRSRSMRDELADLAVDVGGLLALELDARLPRDEGEQQDREDDEDQDEDRGQADGRRPPELWRRYSRIMYPAPRMVWSSGEAWPLSILPRSRDMWTSMTLVCGSK